MKKFTTFISAILLLTSLLTVYASARASDQIDGGWAVAQASSGGEVAVEFQVDGTGRMSKIGANLIVLYENSGSGWRAIKTTSSSDQPSLFTTQAYTYCHTEYFDGVSGRQYYAKVTVFATDSNGTDYKTYISNIITAK